MEKEVKAPHEHKTYEREPLHLIVFAQTKDGTPISYARIYKRSWKQIQTIREAIKEFYGYGGSGYDGKQKLHLTRLCSITGLNENTVRELLVKMAACKKIMMKNSKGRWVLVTDKPMVILQQKAKHVQKEFWGRKCPVYILPFEEKYWRPKES